MSDSDFINPVQHNQDEVLFDSGGTCDCYRLVKDNRVYCVKRPKKDMDRMERRQSVNSRELPEVVDISDPIVITNWDCSNGDVIQSDVCEDSA